MLFRINDNGMLFGMVDRYSLLRYVLFPLSPAGLFRRLS